MEKIFAYISDYKNVLLIQKPASILLTYAHLHLYLSVYEQPRNELDKKISESVEDLLVMLWNCSALSKLLVRLFHLHLNSLTEINMA